MSNNVVWHSHPVDLKTRTEQKSQEPLVLSWLFTQSVNRALAIGLTEVLTKTFLYYGHERIWSRVRLGVH